MATDRNGIIVIGPARQTTPPVSRVIQGIVRDEQGNPLPGATIKIKGTRMGTATDFEGRFQLALAGNAQVLEVSFIGYRTVEVNVQGKDEIEVRLQPDQAGGYRLSDDPEGTNDRYDGDDYRQSDCRPGITVDRRDSE